MYKSICINFRIIVSNITNGLPLKFIIVYLVTKIANIIYKSYNKNFLKFLFKKIYNNKKISETWSANNISYWCYLFFKLFNFNSKYKILEIGSYEGASSILFLNLLKNSNIYCVDTWSDKFRSGVTKKNINYSKIEDRFDYNLKEYRKRVKKFKTESSLFFKKINKKLLFDLIYIDGSHKYRDVLNDAINGFNHLKNRGVIIFDDFNKPEVQKAILFFLNKHSKKINILMVYHQLIIKKIL
jgi:predicted O-methyltransferase YrrM